MRKRLLHLIAAATHRAPWLTLTLVFAATLLAAHLAYQGLRFSADLTQFLPPEAEEVRIYNRTKSRFGSFHYLIAVFESRLPRREAALKELADQYAEAISNLGYIVSAEHKIDVAARDYYLPRADEHVVNLLTVEDWTRILDKLSPESIDRSLQRLISLFRLPEPNRPRDPLLEDPLNVNAVILDRLFHSRGPIDISLRDGYILSEDGRMLLMIIRPQKPPASDHRFARALMDFLRHARDGVFARNPDLVRDGKIEVRFIGAHAETDQTARLVQQDLAATFLVSLVGVGLLFFFALRNPAALVFILLPLVVGVIWTLGLTAVLVGGLNTVTFSMAAVLVGLGVDFAVHIYNRFAEEMGRGAGTRVALDRAIVQTGEGILTGALTTAIAFYGLMLTTFPGFRELGVVAGTGILCCLAAVYLAMPPLMLVYARLRGRRPAFRRPVAFGLGRLSTIVLYYPRATIIVGVIVTAYFAFFAYRVPFSSDWSALAPATETYDTLKRRVSRRFQLPGPPIVAVVTGNTFQEALEANDRLYANLEAARERYGGLLSYDSLRTLLPSKRSQEASRQRVRDLDIGAVKDRLEAAGKAYGFRARVFESFIARLARLRGHAENAGFIDFRASKPTPVLLEQTRRYATRVVLDAEAPRTDRYSILTHIYPREGEWESLPPPSFFRDLADGIDDIEFTGDAMLLADAIKEDMLRDLARAICVVAILVYLLLIFHFHDPRRAAFAMLPVACSLLWMLGAVRLLGLELNLLNIIVLPMIIGLGIDDGIHILQRFFERPDGDVETTVRQTGRAVVVTSLTTMIGFGALSLAHFHGLRQMGVLSILGIGFALIATLTLMPSVLRVSGAQLRLLDTVGRDEGVEEDREAE